MGDVVTAGSDVVLGAVFVACARRLGAGWWAVMFWAGGAAALVGAAVHSGLPVGWNVAGVLVAAAISAMLVASAAELLAPRPARAFMALAAVSLGVYLVGPGGTEALVLSESVTMAAVVGLWAYGVWTRHPQAAWVLVGIGICALSAAFYLLPDGIDPRPLQHLAQIPGILLIFQAVSAGAASPAAVPASRRRR